MIHTEHVPSEAVLMRIRPVTDRIDEMIEKLNHLNRIIGRKHDVGALKKAQTYLVNEIEDQLDRIHDAIETEMKK